MKIRRKHNSCLNCNATLDKAYNYCPRCGQINNDNNVSFGTLVTDFFSNYFALDSRFTHSFKPFFIKPGYLTNRFNEGKRMSYANPVRLYLIISLFFFFIFSNVSRQISSNNQKSIIETTESDTTKTDLNINKENLEGLTSNVEGLSEEGLRELQETLGETGYELFVANLPNEQKEQLIDSLGIEIAKDLKLIDEDSEKSESSSSDGSVEIISVGTDESDGYFFSKFDWDLFDELKENRDFTEEEVIDSIKVKEASDMELHIMKQVIRAERDGTDVFIAYAMKNLPLMMFLLLPIFALLLKLLYIRRDVLYIKHLIHALHLHSFAYLTYGITLLISFYIIQDEDIAVVVNISSFILVSTYAYLSFLRVYQQHWFKTLIKFNIQGIVYSTILIIFFLAELLISFLLF